MIESPDQQHEFDRLLSQMSDGRLGEESIRRLGHLLALDGALRRQYVDYCQMHALLRSEHGLLTSWSANAGLPELNQTNSSRPGWLNRRLTLRLATAAVLMAVALGLAFLNANRAEPPSRGAETAVLSKAVGAQFAYGVNGEVSPAGGVHLRRGLYRLLDGLVEIEYDSGAVLVVRAPATFDLVDEACVRLEDGQLAAHVPKAAIGFRIESPGATVIDLGTDFAVQAVKQKESEVHVFRGEVLIDLHGERGISADLLRLVTGEATRVDYLTGMPSGIDLDDQQFVRSLREDNSSYAKAVLALNPVVYYRMEPTGDGTRLVDASDSKAEATIHFGRATSPVWTAGRVGTALTLGGPSQEAYAAAESYPQAEGDEVSVVAWIYARSRPRWASIAKNWAGGFDDRGQFHFGLFEDGGELEAHIVEGSGKEVIVRDDRPLPLHAWHHVAFVADGTELRLYRNGHQVASKPYHLLHRDPRIKALAIGTKLNLAGDAPEERDFNMWDGRLDELAVFNHALTAEQIRNLYRLPGSID
jgi:Concanavalin A-like lectin/glucanases superfamily/FecR protein